MANNVPPAPPPYQPATASNNPYEFITNTGNTPNKGILGNGSKKQRIIVVAVAATILLTIVVIIAALFSSAGSGQKQEYQSLLQQQAELIRIGELGNEKARDTAAKNLAITASLSLTSSQASLTSLAKKAGANADPKTIALSKNAETDAKLAQAEQASRFDETFIEVMEELLQEYRQTLKSLYDQASAAESKKTLQQAYSNATLLTSEEIKQ